MEDYRYINPDNTMVVRLDTGDVFLASNSGDPRWVQWQTWIGLGNTTQAYQSATPSAGMQWALAQYDRLLYYGRILYRMFQDMNQGSVTTAQLLKNALAIIEEDTGVRDYIIARKVRAGIAGTTLTNADIDAMTAGQRQTLLFIFEIVAIGGGTIGLGGVKMAEED